MAKVQCIYKPMKFITELTENKEYEVLNIDKKSVLIENDLNKVQWYPSKIFRFK